MEALFDEEVGPALLREGHSTESLLLDRYDIAEAVRLTTPLSTFIESKRALHQEITPAEQGFIARLGITKTLLSIVETELERP
jgi:hypothetical protein